MSGSLAMIMHLSTSPARAIVFGQRSEPAAYCSCNIFFCFPHIRRTLKGEIFHDVARTEHSAEEQLLMIQKGMRCVS
jgi:hypothetical protein